MSPIDFFFFFWQYWGLNSWPCTCQAGTLPLEPLTQPPIASLSPSSTSSPDPGPSQSSLRLCPSPLCPPLFCLRIVIWPSAHQPTAPSPISSPKITDHLSGVGGGGVGGGSLDLCSPLISHPQMAGEAATIREMTCFPDPVPSAGKAAGMETGLQAVCLFQGWPLPRCHQT
jgi:hypothetical protein